MKEKKVFHTEFSDLVELDHPLAASNWWRKTTFFLSGESGVPDDQDSKNTEFD